MSLGSCDVSRVSCDVSIASQDRACVSRDVSMGHWTGPASRRTGARLSLAWVWRRAGTRRRPSRGQVCVVATRRASAAGDDDAGGDVVDPQGAVGEVGAEDALEARVDVAVVAVDAVGPRRRPLEEVHDPGAAAGAAVLVAADAVGGRIGEPARRAFGAGEGGGADLGDLAVEGGLGRVAEVVPVLDARQVHRHAEAADRGAEALGA